jgi:hypothetical protein
MPVPVALSPHPDLSGDLVLPGATLGIGPSTAFTQERKAGILLTHCTGHLQDSPPKEGATDRMMVAIFGKSPGQGTFQHTAGHPGC